MKIKSYFAASIAEAIQKARLELGPDAMIVASRKTGPEAMHLGVYEVVLGVIDKTNPPAPAPQAPSAIPAPAAAPDPAVQGAPAPGRSRLLNQLDNVRASFGRKKSGAAERHVYEDAEMREAQQTLESAGFGSELGEELMSAIKRRLHGTDPEPSRSAVREALASEIASRIVVSPEFGRPGADRRILALVGPPGAGKTSTLVKLAVAYGITGRRPMHILSMDTFRLGGADQLRSYAAAMGAPFDAVQTVGALSQAIEEYRSKGLILIDTPGYGPADMEGAAHLASFLSRHAEVDVQLVLPAYMQAGDMEQTASRFRPFLSSRLIFTHVDGAASTGALIAQALRTDQAISFLGTGQQIPEDLEEASTARLLGGFLPLAKRAAVGSVA